MVNGTPTKLQSATPPDPDGVYTYNAEWLRVVDGDTVVIDIDLGCGMWLRGERCRLLGINSPEMTGEWKAEGAAARDQMTSLLKWLAADRHLIIRTHKDNKGKWGRWLVELWSIHGVNINQKMIEDGFAEPYEG